MDSCDRDRIVSSWIYIYLCNQYVSPLTYTYIW